MAASPDEAPSVNQWLFWLEQQNGVLLDTQAKAVDLAETVIRARYGQTEVDEERPFTAIDTGDAWQVKGTHGGSQAFPVLLWVSVVTLHKKSGAVLNFWHQMSDADHQTFNSQMDALNKPEASANQP